MRRSLKDTDSCNGLMSLMRSVMLQISSSSSSLFSWDYESSRKYLRNSNRFTLRNVLLLILSIIHVAEAQNCIPLSSSTMCSAFSASSITATDSMVVSLFPFLRSVSSTSSFDAELKKYISTLYVQKKYQQLLGCSNVDTTNTSNLYARFTTTVLCNAIIQNSRKACDLSPEASRPVCAETCAQQAESESMITANHDLCQKLGPNAEAEIRADFTNCALPANSLASTCITGITNEPNNCGFGNSTIGLCQYCASGGLNSTDTCCYNANAQTRCANVVLPSITGFVTFSAPSPTNTGASSGASHSDGLSKNPSSLSSGAVTGIVIGSLLGLALLAGIIFLFLKCLRRRRMSHSGSIFNQPSSSRFSYLTGSGRKVQPNMTTTPVATTTEGYEILPGGRIARMSALEGQSSTSNKGDFNGSSAQGVSRRRNYEHSSSDECSILSTSQGGRVLRPPPTARRTGSLSSHLAVGLEDSGSPNSGSVTGHSISMSPTSPQSEQLLYFKDYYSPDEIHPGDKVATLWAYQPRAADEFALERGDMLKVTGIWDDGWATGVMIDERADEWDSKHNAMRDSGVANTFSGRHDSPSMSTEIKAFPLVCVCLPEHWRKTIEGDVTMDTNSSLHDSQNGS